MPKYESDMTLIETDSRSRAVIPGRPNQKFIARENEDGSVLLQPAVVVTKAQREYDSNPDLQELLEGAMSSRSVHRARQRRGS